MTHGKRLLMASLLPELLQFGPGPNNLVPLIGTSPARVHQARDCPVCCGFPLTFLFNLYQELFRREAPGKGPEAVLLGRCHFGVGARVWGTRVSYEET